MSLPPFDDAQAPLYPQGIGNTNEYTLDPGVCILPIAEEPPTDLTELAEWSPVVVLRLHAPYRIRRQRMHAEKQNNPPVIPTPADTGKFIFTSGSIVFANTLNNSGQNFDWLVETEYMYVEDCVSRNEDGFVLGACPFVFEPSQNNLINMGGLPTPPTIGAISQAGAEPLLGWGMSRTLATVTNSAFGWGYNVPSYYPGTLLNENLANGGGRTPADGWVL